MTRGLGRSVLLVTSLVAGACRSSEIRTDDLLSRFDEARKQPSATAFELVSSGPVVPSVEASAQSRLTFHVTPPKGAILHIDIGIRRGLPQPVPVAVGVSDGRSYRDVVVERLDPAAGTGETSWRSYEASLEEYAGLTVDVILNARGLPGGPQDAVSRPVVWGRPSIIIRRGLGR